MKDNKTCITSTTVSHFCHLSRSFPDLGCIFHSAPRGEGVLFQKGKQNPKWISSSPAFELKKPREINCVNLLKCICRAAVNTLCGLLRALLDPPRHQHQRRHHPTLPSRLDSLHQVWVRGCFIGALTQPQGQLKVVNSDAHTPRAGLYLHRNFEEKRKYQSAEAYGARPATKTKPTAPTISRNKGRQVALTQWAPVADIPKNYSSAAA